MELNRVKIQDQMHLKGSTPAHTKHTLSRAQRIDSDHHLRSGVTLVSVLLRVRGNHLTNPSRQRRAQKTTCPRETISHSGHESRGTGTTEFEVPDYKGRTCSRTRNLHRKLCGRSSLLRSMEGQKMMHRHIRVRFSRTH